ncbi:MAG: wax ester/triacylglycerol synthase family O-acyltransferase [Solirubrobacteraceae bacterium]
MSTRHGMSSADAAWLHMDRPTNLMVINSVLWFDEPIDWPATQAVLRERMVEPFPRFRQLAVDGRPGAASAWQDDPNFDLALHVHRRGVPAPGDRRALQELVSDLVAMPLDRSKPLWDFYLLEGYGSGCALLVRMHHAIADGIALGRVLLSLTDSDGQPVEFAPGAPPNRGVGSGLAALARPATAAISAGRALAHEGVEMLLHPERIDTLAHTVESDARVFAKFLLPGSDQRSALKGDLGVAHQVAWATMSLATVKRAARAYDATVNDVLVAAVAGAVGEHLRDRGDEVDELHALVPFNLRALDQPLPRDLGNRFGLVLLGLPVGIEDPVERLHAVQERMGAIKNSHEGAIAYGILGAIGRTPPLVEERLVNFFSAKGTMVLTNVPGPRRAVTLAGTPVRGVLVWAPCSGGVGMSVSVFSYAGKVSVGFLVDAGLVARPQSLAAAVRRDVLNLAPRRQRVG